LAQKESGTTKPESQREDAEKVKGVGVSLGQGQLPGQRSPDATEGSRPLGFWSF